MPASKFELFADPATCAKNCGAMLGLDEEEHANMIQRASKHSMIQLSMHHHQLAEKEAAEANKHSHHHKRHHNKHKKH